MPLLLLGRKEEKVKRAKAITYSDNSGESKENAIIISGAENSNDGVKAEYKYLTRKFGDWELDSQFFFTEEDKYYDQLDIELPNGNEKTLYFDISEFVVSNATCKFAIIIKFKLIVSSLIGFFADIRDEGFFPASRNLMENVLGSLEI